MERFNSFLSMDDFTMETDMLFSVDFKLSICFFLEVFEEYNSVIQFSDLLFECLGIIFMLFDNGVQGFAKIIHDILTVLSKLIKTIILLHDLFTDSFFQLHIIQYDGSIFF